MGGPDTLHLVSDDLEVVLLPNNGADIYGFTDRRSGIDVLFKSPWDGDVPRGEYDGSSSMERWIARYWGGWQVLLPNGGDECVENGVTWGYHGEAATRQWDVIDADEGSASLAVRLFTVPLIVRRTISLTGPVVRITETVINDSDVPLEVMWSHHPAFGAPFLDASCVIDIGCRTVITDDDAPGTFLNPGARFTWPLATDARGEQVDLSVVPGPDERRSLLAYLGDFTEGFYAITNRNLGLGFGLRWPQEIFSHAWLWQEVHSTQAWPWFRRAYAMAIEPASTIPGHGMATARSKGYAGLVLAPRASRTVDIDAVIFRGAGRVAGIDEGGTVRFGETA